MSLTPLDRRALRRSFDRAAATYDRHAILAQEAGERLLERVEYVRGEPARVLDLGCATGRLCVSLAKRFPRARVIGLDWAPAMLARSRRGQSARETLLKLCADMHAVPLADRSVDLLCSNLAFSWSGDLPALFAEIRRLVRPGAMVLFSCFGPDTLAELKRAWRSVDDLSHSYDYPDMHDIGDDLIAAGFREPVMEADRLSLEYRDLHSLLADIKGCGWQNAALDRRRGLTGRARFGSMLSAYEKKADADIYPASYEIIFGTAFAPAEGQPTRTREGDVATFSLETLKSSLGHGNGA
jgi:malonyl-CoA O-methyltransferase